MSARKWTAGDAVGAWTDLCLLLWLDTAGIHRPRERERLRAQPWHYTSLAHPFIGYNCYDICTICHHIKMDDHLHSYSHTIPIPKANLCHFANGPFSSVLTQSYGYFPFLFFLFFRSFMFVTFCGGKKKSLLILSICFFLSHFLHDSHSLSLKCNQNVNHLCRLIFMQTFYLLMQNICWI